MKEKIVLIGAGSAMFTRGLLADLIQSGIEAEVGLVDVDPDALRVAEALARKMVATQGAGVSIHASTDRRQVLPGATVVICTVGVGGRRAWEQDVLIPRKFGIFQPVGDTVLPGGTSRAMRMIPAMVAIAEDVLDIAPEALFFNYGNPMGPVCRAVRKATGAEIIGLCHGVHDVARYLARELCLAPTELKTTAVGLNHLTWFVEVRHRGVDMMPQLREIAADKIAFARSGEMERRVLAGEGDVLLHATSPFSWELLLWFGAFPAALDRHVVEFFPRFFGNGEYYGLKLGVNAYSFEDCIARGDAIFDEMRKVALSDAPVPRAWYTHASGEHEQVIDILQSIRQDSGRVFSANLPNVGQALDLPRDAVIEGPAMACSVGMRSIQQPRLAPALVGCMATRLAWTEVVVDAALRADRRLFLQAIALDGAVTSLDQAEALGGALVAAHQDFWPDME